MKPEKKTRVNKSKEQLQAEMKLRQETERRRAFAKEKFYPFLLARTDSIYDAAVAVQVMTTIVDAAYNKDRVTRTVGSLDLKDHLKKMAPDATPELKAKVARYGDLLEMFKDMTIFDFTKIVGDMNETINIMKGDWERTAKMEVLGTPFPEEKIK